MAILFFKRNFVIMNEFIDKDLGTVIITKNSRAKKVIARRKQDQVLLTVPARLTKDEILKHFNDLKPRILQLPVRQKVVVTTDTIIKTLTFDVHIKHESIYEDKLDITLKDKIATISVPPQYKMEQDYIQAGIKDLTIHFLRQEAKRVLPHRVKTFAKKWNLPVTDVKINNSRLRWGSCSNKKIINLSLFLMMVPERVIDYVILHELAHITHLDHSPKFWQLLDVYCNGEAQALNKESTNYGTEHLLFLKD